jgi:uncharacterized small protein (DUF1192 family)
MNLTKRLPLALSIASALVLACFVVYQSGLISDIRNELTWTKSKLIKTTDALEAEMVKNEHLEQELTLLRDSVNLLNHVIEDLNAKITVLKKNVRQLNGQLQRKEDKVVALTKEIGRLKSKSSADERKIADQEKNRDVILRQMETLDRERVIAIEEAKNLKARLSASTENVTQMEQNISTIESEISTPPAPKAKLRMPPAQTGVEHDKITLQPQKSLTGIVSNTTVNFHKIALRNKENGKDLKKVKSNWKFSFLDFELENQNPGAIFEEQFLIQLYDLDSGKVVPMNEYNPEFPDSRQGAIGYIFRYEGQPLSIRYFNSQKKESSNYAARLFYYKKDMVYPLRNGTIQLVRNGEVVAGQ